MQKTQTVCLVVLTILAVAYSLYFLHTVLLPFVIAVFFVIGCKPILTFLETRLKLHRLLALTATFLVGAALIAGFCFLIWISINNVTKNSQAYEARLNAIATWVSQRISQAKQNENNNQGRTPPEIGQSTDAAELLVDSSADSAKAIQDLIQSISGQLQSVLLGLVSSLSTLLSNGVLVSIFVFFLLMGDEQTTRRRPLVLAKVEEDIRKYLVVKTVISLITGLVFGGVLWLFGVPLAFLFGFLAFLLNYIPNIGPLVACVLPVPFLLLNSEMSVATSITCLVLISVIEFVSGNVIETRLMGKSFDVHPVVLLLALMFFGLVWGIVGMFLATPIVSILKIILQQSPQTRTFAELLAGRWPENRSLIG